MDAPTFENLKKTSAQLPLISPVFPSSLHSLISLLSPLPFFLYSHLFPGSQGDASPCGCGRQTDGRELANNAGSQQCIRWPLVAMGTPRLVLCLF